MRLTLFAVSLILAWTSYSQEQSGIVNSNYAGTDAVGFSPARSVYQWQYADIRLLGLGVNVWNNYVFLTSRQRSAFGEVQAGIAGQSGELEFLNKVSDRYKKGSLFAQVEGPAFLIGVGRNAFGAHVTSKAQFSVSGVSPVLAAFAWHGLSYQPQQDIRYSERNLRITTQAYTEFGGTFARQVLAKGNSLFSVGGTFKYLKGHTAGGFLLNELDYELHDSTALTVYSANGEFGFVEPDLNAGTGFGFDLGFHYQRTVDEVDSYVPHSTPYGCEPKAYKYRFSLSVLDIGSIRYRNAFGGVFNTASATIPDYNDVTATSPAEVDSIISNSFIGVDDNSEMRVGLASAIAADFDLRLANHFFIGMNAVQPIGGRSKLRIRRNAFLALVPRIEFERVELALPVTLREYQRPVVGMMLRLNSIVIGSDDVIPWISRSTDIYSADVYAKVKFTLFRRGACNDRRPKAKADVAVNDEASMPCVLPK